MRSDNGFGKEMCVGEKELGAIRYDCAGASARGFVHKENQDRYRISDDGIVLCDGIGGSIAGEVFAEASCWQCDKLLATDLGVDEIIADASSKAVAIGGILGGRGGSSICIAKFCRDGSVDIGSRGDVLAIRISGDRVSIVNKPDYSASRKLKSYVGDEKTDGGASQKYCAMPLDHPDECFVFVTDGVWKSVSLDEMISVWRTSGFSPGMTAEALVSLAGGNGSIDDRTAVICKRVA